LNRVAHIDSIDELAEAVTRAWSECGVALKPQMAGDNDGEKEGHYILVLLEFLYFFVHMVRRYAIPILGQEGEEKLLNELQPLLIDYAVKICFARFDEDYRRHVSGRLPVGLSERDDYYADGDLNAPEPGVTGDRPWIVTMLIRHVNLQSGKPFPNSQITREVINITVDRLIGLDLEKRIFDIKRRGFTPS